MSALYSRQVSADNEARTLPKPRLPFTPEDFLAWEQDNPSKHEYLDGEVFAMAGAKDAHVTVTLNLATLLRSHVRGSPCRVFMADMKVRVDNANAFFYPDVVVTCDARDRAEESYKRYPTLIVEVLSASTSAYDRGRKFTLYRQLDSLQEYVIIDPEILAIDSFRKDASGHWVLYPCGADEIFEIASVGFSVPIDAIYEDVTLPDPALWVPPE